MLISTLQRFWGELLTFFAWGDGKYILRILKFEGAFFFSLCGLSFATMNGFRACILLRRPTPLASMSSLFWPPSHSFPLGLNWTIYGLLKNRTWETREKNGNEETCNPECCSQQPIHNTTSESCFWLLSLRVYIIHVNCLFTGTNNNTPKQFMIWTRTYKWKILLGKRCDLWNQPM